MRMLKVTPDMLATLGGTFYPTGHAMVMYPTESQAREVGAQLMARGFSGDAIDLVSSDTVLQQIAPTVANADDPLPSVGSEAGDVRQYSALARQGHWGLLIHVGGDAEQQHMRGVVDDSAFSIARLYRALVVEDLAPRRP